MKLTTGILAVARMPGASWAKGPPANTQTNAATATSAQGTQQAKPTPGAPAPAVKLVVIPGAQPVVATKPAISVAAKPAAAPAKATMKAVSSSRASQNNRLEAVHVVRNADDVQIKINSREAVTPKVSKLSSPARVVVELPATVIATSQNKIPVGSAGVKGVRIGMDGKTPPTTSVVVDLEQAVGYELMPGPGNEFVLTLHTPAGGAKGAPVKISRPAGNPQTATSKPVAVPTEAPKVAAAAKITPGKTSAPAPRQETAVAKPVVAVPATTSKIKVAAVPATTKPAVAAVSASTAKPTAGATVAPSEAATTVVGAHKAVVKAATSAGKTTAQPSSAGVAKVEAPKPPKEEKKWAMTGKRDPFFSPVVQQAGGSGCSTGKKCLEIGQINVRGVVKSEGGFIAVVTNSMNKAYFLHENDPVFNGYVVRITGDSVVFQETLQDKLGKPFTREVVKRITTPAV